MVERIARRAIIALAFAMVCGAAWSNPAPFADWAAVVVAGDHTDSDGNASEGFDNARRDVVRDLLRIGFSAANLAEFSVKPREYRSENLLVTRPSAIGRGLSTLARRTHGGCLLYFSSHGAPDGLVVGDWIVPPRALARLVDRACGARPTIVIVSACFSGVMLPQLKAPNRLILTAARRDRTSFGCGQTDRYPYFDQCVLESWDGASDFPALGRKARSCIAAREKKEHLRPPSEPQLWIGAKILASLPRWR
jgi:hypothetical protein